MVIAYFFNLCIIGLEAPPPQKKKKKKKTE